MRQSKTDQLAVGFCFHVTGEKFCGVSMPRLLTWYIRSTGLSKNDFLFPRFRYQSGRVVAQGGLNISYSSSASQLRSFCISNRIPVLTLHSGRRGGVTAAVDAGLSKLEIMAIGNWSSDAVSKYYCPKNVGIDFSSRIIKDM